MVFAETLFDDELIVVDDSVWSVNLNLGSTSYTQDGLLLSSDSLSFPFVENISSYQIVPDYGDYILKIKFRYPNVASKWLW